MQVHNDVFGCAELKHKQLLTCRKNARQVQKDLKQLLEICKSKMKANNQTAFGCPSGESEVVITSVSRKKMITSDLLSTAKHETMKKWKYKDREEIILSNFIQIVLDLKDEKKTKEVIKIRRNASALCADAANDTETVADQRSKTTTQRPNRKKENENQQLGRSRASDLLQSLDV